MLRTTALSALLLVVCAAAFGKVGYYQHPAVRGELLVFSAEGDLWAASIAGGQARRLTSHPGLETQPAISPDGAQIAFLASYDAGEELYLMPVAGGAPRRLSWNGGVVGVEGWTGDGRVLFVSDAVVGPVRQSLVRAIDPDTLVVEDWPLAGANQASAGPDGRRYFTRWGLHRTGDHARGYRGGAMAELWYFDPGAEEARPLLPELGANAQRPLWTGDRLYYLSDLEGGFELWSVAADGADRRRHTGPSGLDARHADSDGRTVVFQRGADLHALDLATGSARRIELELVSDLDPRRRRWLEDPLAWTSALRLGPGGERLAVTARGRVALLGLPGTRRVDVGVDPGESAREAVLGAAGEFVYAIVGSGEAEELARFPASGAPGRELLTRNGPTRRWRLSPSPDGLYLAHSDQAGNLWLLDLQTRRNRRIDRWPEGGDAFTELAWSADGARLAWVRPTRSRRSEIALLDVASGRLEAVTSDRFPARAPAFSRDGRSLYFLSDRHFEAFPGAPWGDRNMGPAFDRRARIYALALDEELRFPFLAPELGPVAAKAHEQDEEEGAAESEIGTPEPAPPIAWDGLRERLYEVPAPPGNYARLAVGEDHLYVLDRPTGADPSLLSLAIDPDAELETFAGKVSDFELAADGKKLFFRVGDALHIVDAGGSAPEELAAATVDVDGWALVIDPAREWRQMFDDAWRMHRDFAFDPRLRGVDWEAVREKYAPLVERVTHRAELDDLLGEMIAELGILHSQVGRSELPEDAEQPEPASLAAEFRAVTGGLEIVRILRGDPDLPEELSPLARPEVDAREGDVLVAVNYRPVASTGDLAEALMDQAGRPVVLELQRAGRALPAVRVQPIPAAELPRRRYRHWEQASRDRVRAASDGQVGYLHLYAMGAGDIADFAREFYPQLQLPGLIIDVRSNRGGNVDSWIVNALMRRVWSFWQTPLAEESSFENMQGAYRGHLAVLVDEYTYSDGETFAAAVKALGLAPLLGKRTAGAGIWLTDRNTLADGGIARVAEFAQYGLDGRWLIEGRGVAPDLEVDNPPHAVYRGADPQLEAAVGLLLRRIADAPVPVLRGQPVPPVGTPGEDVR